MAKGGERAKYALITALYNDKRRRQYSSFIIRLSNGQGFTSVTVQK